MVGLLIVIGLLGHGWGHGLKAQSRPDLVKAFTNEIGVRETGGNNRGQRVEEYLKATGTPAGFPWCASFVRWCFNQAGLPVDGNAWSPSWFPRSKTVYTRHSAQVATARPGDVFGIYFSRLKRIGHVGFILEVQPEYFVTVEGNTNDGGSREGDGVHKRYRPHYSIYKIADHVAN